MAKLTKRERAALEWLSQYPGWPDDFRPISEKPHGVGEKTLMGLIERDLIATRYYDDSAITDAGREALKEARDD